VVKLINGKPEGFSAAVEMQVNAVLTIILKEGSFNVLHPIPAGFESVHGFRYSVSFFDVIVD
jgi:hypothetical protein